MRKLTLKDVEAAVKGGSIFASGGGGWVEHGMEIGTAAVTIGQPTLVSVDELPDDAIIITTTAIGAPAGTTDWQMLGKDYIKAVELVQEKYDGKIVGVMTPQNGMSSSINGWLPAAALGLVVVDATGDIRAHPTGNMGAMGLNSNPEYETIEAVAGGKPETGSYIELVVKGSPAKTSSILRTASNMSGGFIASARHPIPASYVKEHAAVGGITMAIELGEAIIAAELNGPEAIIQAICDKTNGEVIGRGKVKAFNVKYTDEAFDIGTVTVETADGSLTLHVMNEYMAVDNGSGKRVTTYPDIITTISTETGRPLSVGDLNEGMDIAVFSINKKHVPISSSVRDASVYPDVEAALGINISDYALEKDTVK
ncbi:DUF917 domain-containing protein [Sporosarcina limicola]|uniref:DUF917 family protein n=1 Tax=Sporosarcina limicola TaxID=34101 RepID=A0A927MEC1_9BACL|nr:DUF917 domain-containing protein [Sporosarcina limicola]MBE1552995.1 DUF917 family protein [Sporosarcina limicola]